mmetsp:Transcript_26671/g.57514  ORF Transcript_26671/g.57514 Transcript_26671/m.57514 type:complete len:249 (-) Transcript_26671:124-870(-)
MVVGWGVVHDQNTVGCGEWGHLWEYFVTQAGHDDIVGHILLRNGDAQHAIYRHRRHPAARGSYPVGDPRDTHEGWGAARGPAKATPHVCGVHMSLVEEDELLGAELRHPVHVHQPQRLILLHGAKLQLLVCPSLARYGVVDCFGRVHNVELVQHRSSQLLRVRDGEAIQELQAEESVLGCKGGESLLHPLPCGNGVAEDVEVGDPVLNGLKREVQLSTCQCPIRRQRASMEVHILQHPSTGVVIVRHL